jgi:hypothetical protein
MTLLDFITQEVPLLKQSSKYTLDRYEGDTAVLLLRENEEDEINIPSFQLPEGTQKGDILEIHFNDLGDIELIKFLQEETVAAKMKAKSLMNRLLEKNHKEQ